jgi:hypothetical protein
MSQDFIMAALLEQAFAERLLQTIAEVRGERKNIPREPRPQFGSARGKVFLADNFDAPLEDFKDNM